MAEYHYKYTNGKPPKKSDDEAVIREILDWVAVIVGFSVFWPIGLVLLFRKLNGNGIFANPKHKFKNRSSTTVNQSINYNYSYNYQPVNEGEAAKSGKTEPQAERSQTAEPMKSQVKNRQANVAAGAMNATFAKPVKSGAGKGFLIAGGITTGIFGFTFLVNLVEFLAELASGNFWSYMVSDMAPLACLTGVGLVLLYVGLSRKKKAKRYKQYLSILGAKKELDIFSFEKATRYKRKTICEDLQDMLDEGYLPMGYLDHYEDKLVLTTEGFETDKEAEADAAEVKDATQEENGYLSEIKAVNDDIDDPIMSAKIDRIGEITGKILAYQRENPNKAGELRSFLNYYLPTTLKILRSYAQLEEQGIEGENISAAKARIEGMMDKVVDGFEKQLDKLFQNDALDISADVEVLEKMLDKDGLGEGMTLGM